MHVVFCDTVSNTEVRLYSISYVSVEEMFKAYQIVGVGVEIMVWFIE
jgi:hypothetical protein